MADAFRTSARSRARRALVGALLLTAVAAPSRAARAQHGVEQAPAPTREAPDPRLSADDVVAILLDALARADAVPAAEPAPAARRPFALVFGFSSPANRAAVGTLERFESMVRDDAYRPLLGHTRAVRGAVRVDGARAVQRVVVTTAYGERVAYTVTLARQAAGPYRNCWMTEIVQREPPGRIAVPRSA